MVAALSAFRVLSRAQLSRASFFFFNDTATTEIYTLSLHDALPIFLGHIPALREDAAGLGALVEFVVSAPEHAVGHRVVRIRSEEHTSELQSRQYLVCRLLLEKKKTSRHDPSNAPAHLRYTAAELHT